MTKTALDRLQEGWFASLTCVEAAGELEVRVSIGNDLLERAWEDEDLSSGDLGYRWELRLRLGSGEESTATGCYEDSEADLVDAQIGLELLAPKSEPAPSAWVEFRCHLQGADGQACAVQVAGQKGALKVSAKKRQRIALSSTGDASA